MTDRSANGGFAGRLVQNFFAVDQPAQFLAVFSQALLPINRLDFLPFKLIAHSSSCGKSTTKKRRTRRKNRKYLRALRFFVIDFHCIRASLTSDRERCLDSAQRIRHNAPSFLTHCSFEL